MKLDIEFRPHKGIVETSLGPVEVTHPQWIVVAVNREYEMATHVGYLGMQPGAPFNGTLQLGAMPVELQAEIIAAVETKAGHSLTSMVPPNYQELEAEAGEVEDDIDVDEG